MEAAETSSNLSEDSEAFSLSGLSNLSTASGLTGYEEELSEIKKILDLGASVPNVHQIRDTEEVPFLRAQLDSALKSREDYKTKILALQRKYELEKQEFFEKLLKFSSFNNNCDCDEIKDKLIVKKKIIEELKNKIIELQVENSEVKIQNEFSLKNLQSTSSEIDRLNKLNVWYKEQLRAIQNEKNKTGEELETLKINLHKEINAKNDSKDQTNNLTKQINELNNENNYLKNKIDKLNKEFEKLFCKIENRKLSKAEITNESLSYESINNFYKNEIERLSKEIVRLHENFKLKSQDFSELSAKNSITLQENYTLKQKTLELNDTLSKNQLSFNETVKQIKLKQVELDDTTLEMNKLKITLDKVNQEKREISESIVTVRTDFKKFFSLHCELQTELGKKNQLVSKLNELNNENQVKLMAVDQVKDEVFKNYSQAIQDLRQRNELLVKKNESKTKVKKKFDLLSVKCKKLEVKCDKTRTVLNELSRKIIASDTNTFGDVSKEAANLRVLLRVKEMELVEKQKRYEINNRTLLRKLKEHLRGKNRVEKQLNIYQVITDEKSFEINSLKESLDEREHLVTTLRETALTEAETRRKAELELDTLLRHSKDATIESSNLKAKISLLTDEIESYRKKEIESALRLTNAKHEANSLSDKITFYFRESETLNKRLLLKEKELLALSETQEELRQDLRKFSQEKYFWQRLGSDLKFALRSTVKQNQVLRAKLTSSKTHPLPNVGNFNSDKISELIRLSGQFEVGECVLKLNRCLDSLKTEAGVLRSAIQTRKRKEFS